MSGGKKKRQRRSNKKKGEESIAELCFHIYGPTKPGRLRKFPSRRRDTNPKAEEIKHTDDSIKVFCEGDYIVLRMFGSFINSMLSKTE